MASRVMSSTVGPRPPVTMITSLRVMPSVNDAAQTQLVVANGALVIEIDARLAQLLSDPGGVGVDDVAEQNFGA
jgi:hypothetical protein